METFCIGVKHLNNASEVVKNPPKDFVQEPVLSVQVADRLSVMLISK